MTLSTLKAIRDGGVTGGVTALVTLLLIKNGADAESAAVAGVICGGIAARAYRYVRVRCPWLAEIDPPADENRDQ
jgi:hypothetical protein